MHQRPQTMMGSCHFRSCGFQANPLDTKRTIRAGQACKEYENCCDPCACEEDETTCVLATAYMPDQVYKAGFCAGETLAQGTYFPELVRPYML